MVYRVNAVAMLAAVYKEFGLPASWQPATGGDPIPCRVIRVDPSEDVAFGGSRARMDSDAIEVRASEVAQPRANDLVTVQELDAFGQLRLDLNGAPVVTVWRVRADPPRDDDGLIWLCDVAEGADGI